MKFIQKRSKRKKMLEDRREIETKLRAYASMETEELFDQLSSKKIGLTTQKAEEQFHIFGENKIITKKTDTLFHRIRESIVNPFNIILLVIAVVTYFTDVVAQMHPDYVTVIIIIALVLLSSIVAFIQSQRSSDATAKLSALVSNQSDVWRDGVLLEIPMTQIVPGDIIKLSAGDMIPADIRFLTTKDTFVSQAALTGESNPVEKMYHIERDTKKNLTDLPNISFLGSNIVSGSATAIVLSTGNDTYFGSMAKSLSSNRSKNSFERGVGSVSRLLISLILVIVPIIFLMNGLIKGDWIAALLFAISVAVGLTPEMLPVIMTSTLAKGAVTMSKHQVIVRNLGSIQTFGAMDILCTDKTGTLTEDKIILEKYMNLHGEDDKRVLRHAYLNSYFQTGLKNLIDSAIIARASKYHLEDILDSYQRVDEIPFDFSRRRMSVVLSDKNGKRQLITKGAVEEIIDICSYAEIAGKVIPLDEKTKQIALETYDKHNTEGLRVIAVAQKNELPSNESFGVKDEEHMVLIGFIGFLDPPKESAKTAITALRDHGVRTVVLTGDSEGVAVKVCQKVGIDTSYVVTGRDIEGLEDSELSVLIEQCHIFAKLSPSQKERIVKAYQLNGHTVGFMGDGINDALALRQADVGISVDTAVDIAKETADIILLKKDLMVLEEGVIEGRHVFGNIMKYIKMAVSGNFGNIISIIIASIFLPFLPMLPIHILTQNLLCDLSQMGISFDHVDPEYTKKPRQWKTKSITSFMIYMGLISSVFDILCFSIMWWIFDAQTNVILFQTGWFMFGTLSQILIIHMIRTAKVPFMQSRASLPLLISTLMVVIVTIIIGFSQLATGFDMQALPWFFVPWMIILFLGYAICIEVVKRIYIRQYGEWT